MTVEDCQKTDEFPFASSDIFLYQEAVFHIGAVSYVFYFTCIKAIKLKHQVPKLELAVQGQGMLFFW